MNCMFLYMHVSLLLQLHMKNSSRTLLSVLLNSESQFTFVFLGSSLAQMLPNVATNQSLLLFLQVIWSVTFTHLGGTFCPENMNPVLPRALRCRDYHSDESSSKPLIIYVKSSNRGLSLSFNVCIQMSSAGYLGSHPWNGLWRRITFCWIEQVYRNRFHWPRFSWDYSYSILELERQLLVGSQ